MRFLLIGLLYLVTASCQIKSFIGMKSHVISKPITKIYNEEIQEYSILDNKDTIEFIVLSNDFAAKKPVFIYLQGSTPVPLGVSYGKPEENNLKDLLAFSFLNDSTVKELKYHYHLVVISMPTVPLFPTVDKLTKDNVWYVKTIEPEIEFYPTYHKANYLDNYVYRTNRVINYLSSQSWVDRNHITLFGHSQGAKVAIKTAVNNENIHSIGFSGGNPYGRMEHIIKGYRYDALVGKMSHEDAQINIDNYYDAWNDIIANPDSDEIKHADANKTFISFEENLVPYFLKLKQPIYVCYGTADPKAIQCDNLPIFFSSAKKTNLTMKPYPGLEHNYYKVDENLNSIGESKWDEVIQSFISWDRNLK